MEKLKKPKVARQFYLIVRGRRPSHYRAPYEKVIVCSRSYMAEWEAKRTTDGHTLFVCLAGEGSNWGLIQYKGYRLTGTQHFKLFDGNTTDKVSDLKEIYKLLKRATWWSIDEMPDWLKSRGVSYPKDEWTKATIRNNWWYGLHGAKDEKERDKADLYELPEWLLPNSEKQKVNHDKNQTR